jgi:serine/threonine-protein kinase
MRGIDPATWIVVSPLLDRAVDLPAEERARLIDALRPSEPNAARLLEELLASHDALLSSDFLETDVVGAPAPTLAGSAVGPYTLDTPLGAGGMGSVWRAHRNDGRFEAAVAIKLLHPGILDAASAARFTREGTLLARLSHPRIARLLDAGVTPANQPYLVLECVDGTRIDRWADEHQLNLQHRLRLMQQVAEAVAHAHAHLIVHRDLKPSNILVDAAGHVKLLDFGIAKLVDGSATADRTVTGSVAFTPEYAAPEQIRGGEITTATDVYALGVILYRLISGRHPTADGEPGALEHARAIVERDPRPLPGVPEDVATIALHALAKDPRRRYQTAAAFGEDIERFLRHEPIRARAESWAYRSRKFVRRHRAAVAAAASCVALLLAAAVITTREMLEGRRQRDRAEFQARRAQASAEFMRHLVSQIGSTPMTMREVLDRGRAALEQQYSGDPAFVARMLMQLSGPYIELGDFDTSAAMMKRAMEIAEKLGDPELLAAAHCGTAFDLIQARDYGAARRHLAEAASYASRSAVAGAESQCAQAETRLAIAERRYEDAVRHARSDVAALEADGNIGTTRYTSALSNLGNAYGGAGHLPQALIAYQRSAEASRRIGHARTTAVVVSIHNQASILFRLGRWRLADGRAGEASELARGVERDGRAPAYLMVNHARVLAALGRDTDARRLIARARAQGDAPPLFRALADVADGDMRVAAGEIGRAGELYAGLQPLDRSGLPPNLMHFAHLLGARIRRAEGRVDEARGIVDRAISESGFPASTDAAQPVLLEYSARLALEAGEVGVAIARAQDAIRIASAQFGDDVPNAYMGRAQLTLGDALAANNRHREAASAFERAAAILEAAAGADHRWTSEARRRLDELSLSARH